MRRWRFAVVLEGSLIASNVRGETPRCARTGLRSQTNAGFVSKDRQVMRSLGEKYEPWLERKIKRIRRVTAENDRPIDLGATSIRTTPLPFLQSTLTDPQSAKTRSR